jgi:hypothetical protein
MEGRARAAHAAPTCPGRLGSPDRLEAGDGPHRTANSSPVWPVRNRALRSARSSRSASPSRSAPSWTITFTRWRISPVCQRRTRPASESIAMDRSRRQRVLPLFGRKDHAHTRSRAGNRGDTNVTLRHILIGTRAASGGHSARRCRNHTCSPIGSSIQAGQLVIGVADSPSDATTRPGYYGWLRRAQ